MMRFLPSPSVETRVGVAGSLPTTTTPLPGTQEMVTEGPGPLPLHPQEPPPPEPETESSGSLPTPHISIVISLVRIHDV